MRHIVLFFILGALSQSVHAQSTDDANSINVPGQRIAPPAKIYRMWTDDFHPYKGAYALSNGKALYLSNVGRRMYAQVEGQRKHEIVATAPDVFVALDQRLDMHIALDGNGNATGELAYIPDAPERGGATALASAVVRLAFQ